MPLAHVKVGKVEHRPPAGAVDNIADGPAHDKADTPSGERPVGSSQPDEQADADRDGDARQQPGRQGPVAAQQAEAHAAVPDDDEPEKALDHRNHAARRRQIAEQQLLGELVDDEGGGDQRHGLAIERSHPRASTAPSQRTQISGCRADLPTSSSTCQQRAHLLPEAIAGTTATPATSGKVKAPSGAGPSIRSPPEVMQISLRSMPFIAARYSGATWTCGAACRLEPMRFSARSSSSAPVTTRRRLRTVFHFSPSGASSQVFGIAG